MCCLGEALRDTTNQLEWCTNVILPGVLDGVRAAGLPEEPPVVIRTHAMDPYAIIPAAGQMYSNLSPSRSITANRSPRGSRAARISRFTSP